MSSEEPVVTEDQLKDGLSVRHGQIRDVKVSLYAIVRDEIFFLPAFFDHYRRLGVEQFIILDDGSKDGTAEYLEKQPDCVLLSSRFRFGQTINYCEPGGSRWGRAARFLKTAIPKKYLQNKYALYADADEFLILPEVIKSLSSLFDELSSRRIPCLAASLIDFFPRTVAGLNEKKKVSSFEELIAAYPCFDAVPLLDMQSGRQPRRANISASTRLFAQYGIKDPPGSLLWLPGWLIDALPLPVPRTAWMKTPIVHWTDEIWLSGSHTANVPPPAEILLAIAHFKFTGDFARRVTAAMRERCHSQGSLKYFQYYRLLQRLSAGKKSFMGPDTKVYKGPESFNGTGLMKWPFRTENSRP